MTRPIAKVVVVGRDAAAWLTALGLQRAFGRTGVQVQVVELPSLLSPVDAYMSLPSLAGLHRILGVDEAQLIAACSGLYALGQRFANWSAGRPPFLHAYDTQPVGLNNVDLIHYWVRGRAEGLKLDFEEFSLGAAMAKQGRMPPAGEPAQGFAQPAHGYHLDALAYVRLLREQALRMGVVGVASGLGEIEVEGERIVSLTLSDGSLVQADLFVDASGAHGALIERLPGAGFEPWSQWLACDRVLVASGPRLDPAPAYSQIAAFRGGWIGLYPLQDRTAIVCCYDSAGTSDEDLLASLPVLTGLTLQGEAVAAPFRAGRRPGAWVGNCVAIGDAAVALEPLDAAPLHLVQTGLSLLISLFPVDADEMAEAKAYNARLAAHARNLRDFQIAHYKLNQRRDDAFWDRARDTPAPDELAYKLRLFAGRGRIALYDDETFQPSSWTSIFVGHGLIPQDHDPLVGLVTPQEQIQQLQNMLRFIAAEVTAAPTLQSQLAAARSARGAPR
ncbi:MAG: hypothetical protein JWP49_1270 [Phenylobacterium sp.]|nr:hypothetical protein [Phenylobacterium sp.]